MQLENFTLKQELVITMYKFGEKSEGNIATLHPYLQNIVNQAIEIFDFSVTEGIRTDERQMQLFKENLSKIDGVTVRGYHQGRPLSEMEKKYAVSLETKFTKIDGEDCVSYAFDGAPYPIDFSNKTKKIARFYAWAYVILTIAETELEGTDYYLRWGGDWDRDNDFDDQKFDDLMHFELRKCKQGEKKNTEVRAL